MVKDIGVNGRTIYRCVFCSNVVIIKRGKC